MAQLRRKKRRVGTEWQLAAFATVSWGLISSKPNRFVFGVPAFFGHPLGLGDQGCDCVDTPDTRLFCLLLGCCADTGHCPLGSESTASSREGALSFQRGGWRQGHPFSLLILAKTLSTCKPSPLWGIWGLLVILPLPFPKTPAQDGFLGLNGW